MTKKEHSEHYIYLKCIFVLYYFGFGQGILQLMSEHDPAWRREHSSGYLSMLVKEQLEFGVCFSGFDFIRRFGFAFPLCSFGLRLTQSAKEKGVSAQPQVAFHQFPRLLQVCKS